MTAKVRKRRAQKVYVDLSALLHVDDFDRVMRAIDGVVARAESLALDDAGDREVLADRLRVAVGAVARLPEHAPVHGGWLPGPEAT